MKARRTWMTAAAVSLGLAVAAWAEGPGGACGGPGGPGFGMRGERGPMFRGPGENEEVMAARRECRDAARRVRMASSDEEREAAMGELREKVRAEVELVDRLQEERVEAMAKIAERRVAELRAQLAEMRAHQEEFIEQEVERMANGRGRPGPEGERGPGMRPPEGEGPCGGEWMGEPPPPPPEDGEWSGRRDGFPHRGPMGRGGPGMKPGRRCGGGEDAGPQGEPPEAPENEGEPPPPEE